MKETNKNETLHNMWKTYNQHKKEIILLRNMLPNRTIHSIQKQNEIRKIPNISGKQKESI